MIYFINPSDANDPVIIPVFNEDTSNLCGCFSCSLIYSIY